MRVRRIAHDTEQRPGARRSARSPGKFVDLHCHCLPNLDDGPASPEAAVALCRALATDNVATVVATPHQLGGFESCTSGEAIRRAARQLNDELVRQGVDLTVLPGAEVRVDERIDELLARDEVLTLADAGRHLLLELPWDVLIDIEPLLAQFSFRGVQAILAHPERNLPLLRQSHVLQHWQACGIGLQITAASLLGDWGRRAKRAAWTLAAEGRRVCIATDAHDDSRPLALTTAFNAVAARLGADRAFLLCVENPARVIHGEKLAAVLTRSQQGVS